MFGYKCIYVYVSVDRQTPYTRFNMVKISFDNGNVQSVCYWRKRVQERRAASPIQLKAGDIRGCSKDVRVGIGTMGLHVTKYTDNVKS